MVNLFLFFFFLLSSSSSFFQTVDHSTLPRETRIRIRIHARMCFGDAHNVPSPQYGNGSWVVSSSCSCTCTHPRTIEFYHIEHTRPSRPLVVSTPPPSFASFSPLYSITLLYNTRKSQYMYIQCTNHRVFLFFFLHTSHSHSHTHTPLSKPIARRIDPLVVKSESTSQITRAISRNLKTENPSSYYYHSVEKSFLFNIYIYIYKLIGERTRVAVIRVAANAGSIGWLDGAAGASSSTQGKELLLPSSSLFRTSVSYIYIYIYIILLGDVFGLVVAGTAGPDPRRSRCPGHRDVEHCDARPSQERREPRPLRALWRRLGEGDASSLRSSGRRGRRRWRQRRHQGRRRRRGQGDCGRLARAFHAVAFQVIYTWVCVLLCTWSPSVLPIAFAGA